MNIDLKDFDYSLPKELIAQKPAEKRDESRLMVLDAESGNIEHKLFKDLVNYLNKGDVLVLNETKVLKAKLSGKKKSGGACEFIVEQKISPKSCKGKVKCNNPQKGTEIIFGNNKEGYNAKIAEVDGDSFVLKFERPVDEVIKKIAVLPTPPYIKEKVDYKRYQTVFCKVLGSLAAPTAALHFTEEMLEKIEKKGVEIAKICLHIGFGTFLEVREENIKSGKLHNEWFEVSKEAADTINNAKKAGKKVFAVGTTVVRAIESSSKEGKVIAGNGSTDLFIYPDYKFNFKFDGLVTNFHLPKSSLLMLVAGFAGRSVIMDAYSIAIHKRYRFFSFGDAMLILNTKAL